MIIYLLSLCSTAATTALYSTVASIPLLSSLPIAPITLLSSLTIASIPLLSSIPITSIPLH